MRFSNNKVRIFMNVWYIIDNQYPIPINNSLGIVDRLEYVWKINLDSGKILIMF